MTSLIHFSVFEDEKGGGERGVGDPGGQSVRDDEGIERQQPARRAQTQKGKDRQLGMAPRQKCRVALSSK